MSDVVLSHADALSLGNRLASRCQFLIGPFEITEQPTKGPCVIELLSEIISEFRTNFTGFINIIMIYEIVNKVQMF